MLYSHLVYKICLFTVLQKPGVINWPMCFVYMHVDCIIKKLNTCIFTDKIEPSTYIWGQKDLI